MRCIDYFDKGAEIEPERAAIVQGDLSYTFAEVQALTFKIASAMKANGLKHQDHVAIYSPNHAGVILTLLSIWRAAAIWIPVNARNAIDANIQYMNYVRTSWLFYHSQYAKEVAQLKAGVPSLRHFVCLDREHEGNPSLANFMKAGEGKPWADDGDPFGNLDEVVGIFPTGGTTGPAKGVNVTNLGWGTMLEIVGNALRCRRHQACLPCAGALDPRRGTGVAGDPRHRRHECRHAGLRCGQSAREHRALQGHPSLLPSDGALYASRPPELARPQLFELAPLSLGWLARSRLTNSSRRSRYSGLACASHTARWRCRWFSLGFRPMSWRGRRKAIIPSASQAAASRAYPVRVGIMDDAGKLLPVGEPGEIVARGALVSHSYFEKPEATTEVRTFGWHHTGDVGYRDKDGYIYIVDRKKDMIVTGGFNVFSAEVEACVMEMQGVLECAVVGVPHDKWGEAIKAIVVPARGVNLDRRSRHRPLQGRA